MQVEAAIVDSDFSRRYVRVVVDGEQMYVRVDRNGMALGVYPTLAGALAPTPESHSAALRAIPHDVVQRAEKAAEGVCPRLVHWVCLPD